ncbi:MAG TPA: hypothetical protein VJR29_10260 [bacterium]|nr:hypothetical protein [bacterium]
MNANSRRRFLMSLMIPFTLGACSKSPEPEKAAKAFIDAYYVKIDLKAAKDLSSGLALEKIDNQIGLIAGQPPDQGADLPKVDAHLASAGEVNGDEATYIFEVKPQVQDVGARKVFVKLRHENGVWKVSQFTEESQGTVSP